MKILGIGGQGYRDSSAGVVVDGRVVAAASEERFSRQKHEGGFPARAVQWCLAEAGLRLRDLDRIAIANNPWLNLKEKLEEWYGVGFLASQRFRTFHIFHDEMHRAIRYLSKVEQLRDMHGDRVEIVRHHLCHLAESFFLSPFEEAAILAIDGRGEVSTSSLGQGRDGRVEFFSCEEMPNSIGLLCASVADFLGFREEDDEFRIMSISSMGRPRYLDTFRQIVRLAPGGSYQLNQEYFDTFEGRAFLSERFSEELGPGREPGDPVTERHSDLAASLQRAVEEVTLHMAEHLAKVTGSRHLCFSGGVAQNWVLGGRLRADGPFDQVHTGFAPGDEGTALGAALHVESLAEGLKPGSPLPVSAIGPGFGRDEVTTELQRLGLHWEIPEDPVADAAERIARGRLIGWFEGAMEFGPRALGHRSIFADPMNSGAKERLVATVKPRARYHPFGVVVTAEDLGEFFVDSRSDPHMASHRQARPEALEILAPVLHADGTARVQSVAPEAGGSLAALLGAVGARTGHRVLLNTSLNTPGKPIACAPRDAVETFYTCGLDDLFVEGLRLSKCEEAGS